MASLNHHLREVKLTIQKNPVFFRIAVGFYKNVPLLSFDFLDYFESLGTIRL